VPLLFAYAALYDIGTDIDLSKTMYPVIDLPKNLIWVLFLIEDFPNRKKLFFTFMRLIQK
jgi:hypothetical protein